MHYIIFNNYFVYVCVCVKGDNFQRDQMGMRVQLAQAQEIIRCLDPKFHQYLDILLSIFFVLFMASPIHTTELAFLDYLNRKQIV